MTGIENGDPEVVSFFLTLTWCSHEGRQSAYSSLEVTFFFGRGEWIVYLFGMAELYVQDISLIYPHLWRFIAEGEGSTTGMKRLGISGNLILSKWFTKNPQILKSVTV